MGDLEVHALRGIDMDIHKSDFVAIMGKSGSGKSTFMNIVGCLDIPTRGNLFTGWSGCWKTEQGSVGTAKKSEDRILCSNRFNLLSRTSALENVELPLMYNSKVSSNIMR